VARARPLRRGRRVASADEAGLDALPVEPLQRDAVLGIEEFHLEQAAGGIGHMKVLAVGQHAVDVHEHELDLGRAGADFFTHLRGHL